MGSARKKNDGGDIKNCITYCDRSYTREEILDFINHKDSLRFCECDDIRFQVEEPHFSQYLLFSQANPAFFGEHFETFRTAQRAVKKN